MNENTILFVYDSDLRIIGGFDGYKSLIWTKRYFEDGDCEVYAPATDEALDALKIGRFVRKMDDDMICLLQSIEIESSTEDGDYIIAKGASATCLLDRRIVWKTSTCYSKAEPFLRKIVEESLGERAGEVRAYLSSGGDVLFRCASAKGFTDRLSYQVTYKTVGETVREICRRFGWGHKVSVENGILTFSLYAGTDRSESVIFSDELENLIESDYLHDESRAVNVALVAGEGEGASRVKEQIGDASGKNRFEIYVDARDLSKKITWGELVAAYPRTPDGNGYIDYVNESWCYRLTVLDVPILSESQKAELIEEYPNGEEVTIDGEKFYRLRNVIAADIPSQTPETDEEVTLRDVVYSMYLVARGAEKLAAFGVETKFNGTIEPATTFVYGTDYYLGDIVTVRNHYGITAKVRITEVVEVADENGFSVQPSFEHLEGGV